jgi:hypothetical protein
MTAIQNLFNADESLCNLTENQDLLSNGISNEKYQQEVTMLNNEAKNQTEQLYYNKASGCSVKAQKDNLFDYKSWIK